MEDRLMRVEILILKESDPGAIERHDRRSAERLLGARRSIVHKLGQGLSAGAQSGARAVHVKIFVRDQVELIRGLVGQSVDHVVAAAPGASSGLATGWARGRV